MVSSGPLKLARLGRSNKVEGYSDAQRAHAKKGDVTRAYDRAKFLEERVVMMQRRADCLSNNISGDVVLFENSQEQKIFCAYVAKDIRFKWLSKCGEQFAHYHS